MAWVAWTPPDCQWGLGSVPLLESPKDLLTRERYRLLLAQRIDRLVAKAGLEEASDPLARFEELERFSLAMNPRAASLVLAENSDWLAERAAFPPGGVKAPLEHRPETAEPMEKRAPEEFLALRYP